MVDDQHWAVTPANLALRQAGRQDARSGSVSMRDAAPQASAALAGLPTAGDASRPPRQSTVTRGWPRPTRSLERHYPGYVRQ